MILNDETYKKVARLVTIPLNTIEYNGSYGDCVLFLVGVKENYDWKSGVALYVTEEFKLSKCERIRVSSGRFTRNYPVRTTTIPLVHKDNYSFVEQAKEYKVN